MKAIRAHQRGGPEVLCYEDAPVPEVGAREVLVEVHAAAVTPGELGLIDFNHDGAAAEFMSSA